MPSALTDPLADRYLVLRVEGRLHAAYHTGVGLRRDAARTVVRLEAVRVAVPRQDDVVTVARGGRESQDSLVNAQQQQIHTTPLSHCVGRVSDWQPVTLSLPISMILPQVWI